MNAYDDSESVPGERAETGVEGLGGVRLLRYTEEALEVAVSFLGEAYKGYREPTGLDDLTVLFFRPDPRHRERGERAWPGQVLVKLPDGRIKVMDEQEARERYLPSKEEYVEQDRHDQIEYTGDNEKQVAEWLGDAYEKTRGGLQEDDPRVIWFRPQNNSGFLNWARPGDILTRRGTTISAFPKVPEDNDNTEGSTE